MASEDIGQQNSLIDTSPDQAVKNIQGASFFDIPTDIFRTYKENLQKEMDNAAQPSDATPAVAEYAKTSPDHAAAVSEDLSKLNVGERIYRSIGNAVMKPYGPEAEASDLWYQKMNNGGKLSDDDQMQLDSLEAQNANQPDFHLNSWYEKAPAFLAGVASDLVATATKNKAVMGTFMAGEAGIGAGSGALAGLAGGPLAPVTSGAGALAGATTGLVSGTVHGYMAAGVVDSYKKTSASAYKELSLAVDKDNKPLNMDEFTKFEIAQGVGVLAGGINYGASKLFMKNAPFLQRLQGGNLAATIAANPAARTMLAQIGALVKNATITGGSGALTKLASIAAGQIGQATGGNSDLEFMNGLKKTYDVLKENAPTGPGQPGAVTQVIEAGGESAASGIAGHVVMGAGEHVLSKALTPRPAIPEQTRPDYSGGADNGHMTEAGNAHAFADAMKTASKVLDDTKLKGLDPAQIDNIRDGMLDKAGFKKVYLDKDAATEWAKGNQDKALALRRAMAPDGLADTNINAPMELTASDASKLVDQFPDIADELQLRPGGPSARTATEWVDAQAKARDEQTAIKEKLGLMDQPSEDRAAAIKLMPDASDAEIVQKLGTQEAADAYLARLHLNDEEGGAHPDDIATMNARVTALRDKLPNDETTRQVLTDSLNQPAAKNDVWNEDDHLPQPTTAEAIADIYPDHKPTSKAEREARQARADAIAQAEPLGMNHVIDVVTEMNNEIQRQQELTNLENSPELRVQEMYSKPPVETGEPIDPAFDLTRNHAQKGFSPFAIDPKFLTPEQKAKYLDNVNLKEAKVFVEGGMSPDDSGALVAGIKGDELLDLLSRTPSRERIVEARVQANKAANAKRAADSVDMNRTSVADAFQKATDEHLAGLKDIKDVDAANDKQIALDVPTRQQLTDQARAAVEKLTIKDLNPEKFEVGERKSQRKSNEAIADKDMATAFVNKQAAAMNTEMQSQVRIAIGEMNQFADYAKKFYSSEFKELFHNAGPTLTNAAREILNAFNLRPESEAKYEEVGKYQAYVKDSVRKGIGNFEIPNEMSDVREQWQDMTVEQARVIHDRLKTLEGQARNENQLIIRTPEQIEADQAATANVFARKLRSHLEENNKFYKVGREIEGQGTGALTPDRAYNKVIGYLNNARASMENFQAMVRRVDGGTLTGLLHDEIIPYLKGIGENGAEGEAGKARLALMLDKGLEKLAADFGPGFKDLKNNTHVIPEFKDLPELSNGHLSDWDLLQISMHRGNTVNSERVGNFGADPDFIFKTIDKYTDARFPRYAQGVMDLFASLRPHYETLYKNLGVAAPKWVEPVPFEAHGETFRGGYYPIKSKGELSTEAITARNQARLKTGIEGQNTVYRTDTFDGDQMTRDNHLKMRGQSDKVLDISGNITSGVLDNMIHDLAYRRPLAHATRILTHPDISVDIARVGGNQMLNTMTAMLENLGQSAGAENAALHASTQINDVIGRGLQSNYVQRMLSFNPKSMVVQFGSMINATCAMGIKGIPHLISTHRAIIANGGFNEAAFEFAGEIHPPIKAYLEGQDSNARRTFSENDPTKTWSKATAKTNQMLDTVSDVGMHGMEAVDNRLKTTFSLAAYRQFLAGDVEGTTSEMLHAMTDQERDQAAKNYASSFARTYLTAPEQLDRNVIQSKYAANAKFFNDSRGIISEVLSQADKTVSETMKGNYGRAAGTVAVGFISSAMVRAFEEYWKGILPQEWGDDKGLKDPHFYANAASYILTAPGDLVYSNTPYMRDIMYALNLQQKTGKYQKVQNVTTGIETDIKDGINLAQNFMDYVNGNKTFGSRETRQALNVISLVRPLPVNGAYKIAKAFEDYSPYAKKGLSQAAQFAASFKQLQANADQVSPETMKQLDQMNKQLNPEPPSEFMNPEPTATDSEFMNPESAKTERTPQSTFDIIKQIESAGGKITDNPNSSATGDYQMMPDTWKGLMENHPELKLTKDGIDDPAQQERAMRALTEDNTKELERGGIDPTVENVYAAHFLGGSTAVDVLKEVGSTKLKTIVGAKVMAQNKFPSHMTVRAFKVWVKNKVDDAREELAD